MKAVLTIVALALAAPVPRAQEAKALHAFKQAFAKGKKAKTVPERFKALAALSGYDSVKVATALVKAFQTVEAALGDADAGRLAINEEMAQILDGKEFDTNRTLPQAKFDRFEELEKLSKVQRKLVDDLRGLRGALADRIRKLKAHASVAWLLRTVLGNRKNTVLLKVTAAAAAGGVDDTILGDVEKTLRRLRKRDDLAALLEGIGLIGKRARPLAPALIKLLAHKDAVVRERAAVACAQVHVPAAVEPMIGVMAASKGMMKRRVSLALEDMTGQQLGLSETSWRGWFEREGKAWIARGGKAPSGPEARGDMFRVRSKKGLPGQYYFGIPQDGEAILYIIDSSGSMKAPVEWGHRRRPGGGRTRARKIGEKGAKFAMTRLEACKTELIAAIERLQRTKKFNIVWYNDLPHMWEKSMQLALPSRKTAAIEWVRRLKPASTTNIHDAMQMGFGIVKGRRGLHDKAYSKGDIGLDTIFLLTDGSPTTPDGKLDDPEKILKAVRQWNPLRRVTVHTIGIGDGLNLEFLQDLAAQNGGEFKHYTDQGERRR